MRSAKNRCAYPKLKIRWLHNLNQFWNLKIFFWILATIIFNYHLSAILNSAPFVSLPRGGIHSGCVFYLCFVKVTKRHKIQKLTKIFYVLQATGVCSSAACKYFKRGKNSYKVRQPSSHDYPPVIPREMNRSHGRYESFSRRTWSTGEWTRVRENRVILRFKSPTIWEEFLIYAMFLLCCEIISELIN